MKPIGIILPFLALLALDNVGISIADSNAKQQTVSSSTNAGATNPSTLATVATVTTAKPKILLKDSELCKKCSCDTKQLQMDCTNQSMTTLFSADEWQTLQNGDVLFETIKLDYNEISYIPALPTYTVKSLYLSSNKISNISIGAFQNLSQLTVLDLSNNELTSKSLKPHVFKGMYAADKYEPLKNLKSLDLSSNKMHTLNSDLFEHLPNLETLILSKNSFQVIDPSTTIAIANLNSLRTLDMSYMELSELPDTTFHSLSDLETLNLSGNLFHILPAALTRAKHLKKLILDENPLADLDNANTFRSLGELEYLSISYLQDLTKIGPWALSDLQNLTTLVAVSNPRLAHIDKLALAKNTSNPDILDYPPLKRVLLYNNNLTTIEHNWIFHWEKIVELDLRFNPWACDCSNSWLIHSLMKQINNTTPLLTREVACATPSVWKNKPLMELSDNKKELLCKNTSPKETNSLVWVGILVGILVGISITLGGLVVYRRDCFGVLNRRNPVADRSLYNRATFADEFHI